ncbi:MAG: iron ABC transporter permease [Syntrophomonadaceae bacterium]|nr:iron ABC transporter permease [Syntrophomonadaceae bacterium]
MVNKRRKEVPFKKSTSFADFLAGFIYFLVAISVLVFILWPTIAILVESVSYNGDFTLAEYIQLFTRNKNILFNSIFVSAFSTVLAVTIGLFVALFISHSKNRGKKLTFAVLLLTMISPPFVSALSYIMLFGRRGIITYHLLGLTVNPYGWHGVVIMQALSHASLAALIILGVLRGIDKSLEQASLDLGAGSLETLFKITLPLVKPGIIAAALIAFIQSLADFGTPAIIGGNFSVLATEAYLNVIGLYNLPRAAAMGTLLMIPALLMFIIYRRVVENSEYFSLRVSSESPLELSGWVNCSLALVTGGFILFQIVQYTTILWGAFAQTWGVDFSLSLRHIKALEASQLAAFGRSLEYALIAALVGTLIGMIVAYMIERKKFPGYRILDFLVTLPYMIPGPFLGIAYVLAFHNKPVILTGTAFIVVVNCIYRQLPIGTKAGTAVLTQLNPETEYSARDLGADEITVFKDIILPSLKPAFLLGFVNTFTTTMTTIGAIIFLVVPGSEVATVQMFNAIKTGQIGVSAVIANMIILVTLSINLAFSYFILRSPKYGNSEKREGTYVPAVDGIK